MNKGVEKSAEIGGYNKYLLKYQNRHIDIGGWMRNNEFTSNSAEKFDFFLIFHRSMKQKIH